MKSGKRAIFSWCLFDWAIAPFSVLITTFIFSTYFTKNVAINPIVGTTQWGEANGIAGLVVALLSPILGAIADHEGRRKPWLKVLTGIVAISAAALWWVKPEIIDVPWALAWVMIGTAAVEISTVFYNAMLNELAPPGFLGRLSGWGWGCGYVGGLVALILTLGLFIGNQGAWLGLNPSLFEQVRICGPLVALWVILFSWPLFLFTPDRPATGRTFAQAIQLGFRSLGNTLRLLHREYRNILIFLIARMFYTDGLITVFAFGGIYAAGTFHMDISEVIKFGITMNMAAGLGAAIFGWLDDAWGPKPTILMALLLMIGCGLGMILTENKLAFWLLGIGLSLGVGPAQAASRSFMIRIAPQELITELFGLYNFSGKATTFIGPWVLAWVTQRFANQRAGMSTVFFFMAIGGVLLLFVKSSQPTAPRCEVTHPQ